MDHQTAKGGAQSGHEQCRGDAFAADVCDDAAEEACIGDEDVVVVAADLFCAFVAGRGVDAGNGGDGLGKKTLLDLAGQLKFACQFRAVDGLFAEGLDEHC